MATGDLIQFEVLNADAIPNGGTIKEPGKIARLRFEGIPVSATVDITKLQLTVSRPGYSKLKVYSATNTVDVIGTEGVYRRPTPNETLQLTNVVGSDLDVYVSLRETVFISDTVTNIQVQAGFYGACTTSSLPTGTNNSTKDYPKPIFSWLFMEPWDRLGPSGLAVECIVDHWGARLGQTVAAVEPYVTATAESSVLINQMTASQKNKGPFPIPCFAGTIPITGLTNGAGTLNARIYPWVGTTFWDTASLGDPWPTYNLSSQTPVCVDSTGAYLPAYAYVSHTGVTIGSPVVSTTHPGNYTPGVTPAFSTVVAAAQAIKVFNALRGHDDTAAGVVILPNQLMLAGLTASMQSLTTYPVGLGWLTIEPEPNATKLGTGFTSGAGSKIFSRRTKFKNLEIRPGAAGTTHTVIDGGSNGVPSTQLAAGDANYYLFSGCIGTGNNDNANSPVFRPGYSCYHNCTFADMGDDIFSHNGNVYGGLWAFHGNDVSGAFPAPVTCATIAGSRLKQIFAGTQGAGSNNDFKFVMRWNMRMSWENQANSTNFGFSRSTYDSGISVMNVLLVKTNALEASGAVGGSPCMQVSADSNILPMRNTLISHLTAAGGRCNVCYQDTGTVWIEKEVLFRYSAPHQKNSKADMFPAGVGGVNGSRTGTFAYRWGTDNFGVVTADTSANSSSVGPSSWLGDVTGPDCQNNVGYANMFVDDVSQAGSNTDATLGDYTPKAVLLNRVKAGRSVIPFDLVGRPVPTNGSGAAGAMQLAPTAVATGKKLMLGCGW